MDIKYVHGNIDFTTSPEDVVVVCLVRDGELYIRSFIEHYFNLGAKHIVLLDNQSRDGTIELARSYADVSVLWSDLPFRTHKNHMRQYLINRFARERWIIYADIDELFLYPHADCISLSSLVRYLNHNGYTGVVGQMLDMFSQKSLADLSAEEERVSLCQVHRFYDLSSIRKEPYPEGVNVISNPEIKWYFDGIRRKLFGLDDLWLTKHPMMFGDGKISAFRGNSHRLTGARLADFSGVLLHYKFTSQFRNVVERAVAEQNYFANSRQYRAYANVLEACTAFSPMQSTARELKDVDHLIDEQFIHDSLQLVGWQQLARG